MSPFAVPGLGVYATEADAQAAIAEANRPPRAPKPPAPEPDAGTKEGEPS